MGLLVLSRKRDESLIVTMPDGRTIEVLVVRIDGRQVKIGIRADQDVRIVRKELVA